MPTPHALCLVMVHGHIFMVNEVIVPPITVTRIYVFAEQKTILSSQRCETQGLVAAHTILRDGVRDLLESFVR